METSQQLPPAGDRSVTAAAIELEIVIVGAEPRSDALGQRPPVQDEWSGWHCEYFLG